MSEAPPPRLPQGLEAAQAGHMATKPPLSPAARAALIGITALLVGCIHILPNLLFRFQMGADYSFTNFKPIPDEEHYWARIRDVYDGDLIPRHSLYAEHARDPVSLPPLPEMAIGLAGRLLGIDISNLAILVDGIMPALIFLCAMAFLRRSLGVGFGGSYVGALAAVFMSVDIARPPELLLWAAGRLTDTYAFPIRNEPFWIDRTVSPQFYYPWFILYLMLLFRIPRQPGYSLALVCGGVLACLGFQSPFFFIFAVVSTGLLGLYDLTRSRKARALLPYLLVCGLGLLVIFPFAWHFRTEVAGLPGYRDWQERGVGIFTRVPQFSVRDIVLAVAFPFLARRTAPYFAPVYLLLLAGLICTNLQLLFGFNIIPWHFMLYTNAFWAVLAVTWALSTRFHSASARLKRGLLIALACMLFANGLFVELRLYLAPPESPPRGGPTWRQWAQLQPYGAALSWLNRNAPPGSVVVGGATTSVLVPVLTHCNVYVHSHGQFGPVTTSEQIQRLIGMLRFYQVPRDRAGPLAVQSRWMGFTLLAMVPRNFYEDRVPAEAAREISAYVQEHFPVDSLPPSRQTLQPYRVDFALVGAFEEIEMRMPDLRSTMRVRLGDRLRYSDNLLDLYDLR